ncbi:NAD-dependent epimerase/dehydratase family protein [Flavobacteriales bacterium]|jgi:nucleoside-diphosphate-sugar epimerase|nr:NAD-dependent epimerase/dehydratase family protein [Flavobacteriales bacterium]
MKDTILIIGASGQIGTELVITLRKIYGDANVIATDIRPMANEELSTGPFEVLDIMDQKSLFDIVKKYKVTQVYLLAALLSATAEKNIELGWSLNMRSLSHVLDLAREKHIKKVYWPSSIAVFGPSTPSILTPQRTIMEPNTVYGISKLAGERWCEYYHEKFGVDVRSIRYPGLIGWKSAPGGGTTDYAVHIFHEALKSGQYTSFLSEDTTLPMMHMNDAIRATLEIMEAPAESIKIRSSYNVAGLSFSPKGLASEIQKHIPDFKMSYESDYRQAIADSWPKSIDDSEAKTDWNWKSSFNLQELTSDMLTNIKTLVNQ